MHQSILGLLLTCWISASTATTHAQTSREAESPHVAATHAYARGEAANRSQDYRRAARYFESAYHLQADSSSLIAAIRAHERAEHWIRVGNLALQLRIQHADEPNAHALANTFIESTRHRFFWLDVDCTDCTLRVDGRAWDVPSAMLAPGTEHRIVIARGNTEHQHIVRGDPDTHQRLAAPGEPPTSRPNENHNTDDEIPDNAEDSTEVSRTYEEASADDPRPPPAVEGLDMDFQPEEESRSQEELLLHPAIFLSATGLTALSTSLLIWSGIDAASARNAFNTSPSAVGGEAAEEKEIRTYIFLGATLGLAVAATTLFFYTNWNLLSGVEPSGQVQLHIAPSLNGAFAELRARFP